MDYSKYSKHAFEKAGVNTEAARFLADALEQDVLKELDQEIQASFQKIVSKLNEEGHKLSPYVQLTLGDYSFRDKKVGSNDCGLRLSCDVVISAGYSHIVA